MNLKNLGHGIVVVVLGSIGFAIGGHIPAITPILNESVGTVLSVGLSWAYIHFGIVQPTIVAAKAGKI